MDEWTDEGGRSGGREREREDEGEEERVIVYLYLCSFFKKQKMIQRFCGR